MKKLALSLLALMPLCASAGPLEILGVTPSSDKVTVCNPKSFDEIKDCPNGVKMFFQPGTWGNEQLPLLAIAGYCDTNKPVFYNNGGVVCIKTPFQQFSNPAAEKIKVEWKKELNKISANGSGWKQVNDSLWIKVIKSSSNKVPERPFDLKYEAKYMNASGSFNGTNPEIDSMRIKKDTDNVFADYPAGTELECFRYFENDPRSNQRFSFVIKEETPYKEEESTFPFRPGFFERPSQPESKAKEESKEPMTSYEMTKYLNRIEACVRPHINFRKPAKAKPGQYVATFEVQLSEDGRRLGFPKLLKSSGLSNFDFAVESAIMFCDPFPKPDAGAIPESIQLKIDVVPTKKSK